ncbi:MAG: glycoside hydrolase family 92 protein [Verrucomicrobiaceae bacterium]|nr:glycoside hydrolase family 92 protein [Verrucomicrobiaceae bacterium]
MKNYLKNFLIVVICSLFVACDKQENTQINNDFTRFVVPTMGTLNVPSLSNGNLYPIIALPHAMNHWTVQTLSDKVEKYKMRFFYNYADNYIWGFRQSHQPSPWVGDYGCFSLMPTVEKKSLNPHKIKSWYSHKSETVAPNYYSVYLADYDINAEVAPTERCAIMRFTFPQTNNANIVIDAFDEGSEIKVIPEKNMIVGTSSYSCGSKKRNNIRVPKDFKNYFVIIFNKSFDNVILFNEGKETSAKNEISSNHAGAVVSFKTNAKEKIEARIASSFISFEQAEQNMLELKNKSLEDVSAEGRKIWNTQLGRFKVLDNDLDCIDNLRKFYSCLYRTLLYPRKLYEIGANGNIQHRSPFNNEICKGKMYTDNGYWDTFRAVHPFFNLFYPETTKGVIEGMVNSYKEGGWLPEWASPGYFDCMIGNNSISIATSAHLQNLVPQEMLDTLWQASVKSAKTQHPTLKTVGRWGVESYEKLGYVPNDIGVKESASRTIEYSYADYCAYLLGKSLKKEDSLVNAFKKNSLNYRNVFDKSHNLMVGRDSNGNFNPNFNKFSWGGDFTEGNSLHYSFAIMHDVQGLANLMGGTKKFEEALDQIFALPPVFDKGGYSFVIHEIREMQIVGFGQYAHGNQPIQHGIYLYNWTNSPYKSQYWIRKVMDKLYHPAPDGYAGDEDNGQTSAWFVFSSLGFYPVCPVDLQYPFGSPLFKDIEITMPNGKLLKIKAKNNSSKNVYIASVKLNGKIWNKNYLDYADIKNGGELIFEMACKPNLERGTKYECFPKSLSTKILK